MFFLVEILVQKKDTEEGQQCAQPKLKTKICIFLAWELVEAAVDKEIPVFFHEVNF